MKKPKYDHPTCCCMPGGECYVQKIRWRQAHGPGGQQEETMGATLGTQPAAGVISAVRGYQANQ